MEFQSSEMKIGLHVMATECCFNYTALGRGTSRYSGSSIPKQQKMYLIVWSVWVVCYMNDGVYDLHKVICRDGQRDDYVGKLKKLRGYN